MREENIVEIKNQLIDNWCNQFKGARRDVLTFIVNVLYSQGSANAEIIRSFFVSGYCYYFALMLKDAFGGEMCWHKGYSHIVWKDTDGIVYDIDGVFYNYEEDNEIVSLDILKSHLEAFRHRGHDDDIRLEIEKECEEKNISKQLLIERVFENIPNNERVRDYPNIGDVMIFWETYKNLM